MKMTPCAINIHPPRIHIHSFPVTDAGCQPVPDPSCGEGNCSFVEAFISICIPAMGAFSCARRSGAIIRNSRPTNLILTETP